MRRPLVGGRRHSAVQPDGLGNPFVDGGPHVCDRLDKRVAIGHAAGKIRHPREIPAAVLWLELLGLDFVSAAHCASQDFRTKPTKARI